MANYHLVQQRGSLCNFLGQSDFIEKRFVEKMGRKGMIRGSHLDLSLGRRENGEKRNGGERRFLGCQVLSKRGKM